LTGEIKNWGRRHIVWEISPATSLTTDANPQIEFVWRFKYTSPTTFCNWWFERLHL